MSATPKRLAGPTAATTSAANLYNPAANTYAIVRHIHVSNKSSGAVTLSMWIGATGASAAGTEFVGNPHSIAANSEWDWYGVLRMDNADFLTWSAGAATSLTAIVEGDLFAA